MSAIPFHAANNVPILGQPFTFRSWFPSALLNCSCVSHHAMLLQGLQNPAFCPDCGKGAMIVGLTPTPTGEVGIQIAPVVRQETPPS